MDDKNQNQTTQSDELPSYSADGVDLTLIRWMLSLTPEERLRRLEEQVASARELRHANAAIQLPPNS